MLEPENDARKRTSRSIFPSCDKKQRSYHKYEHLQNRPHYKEAHLCAIHTDETLYRVRRIEDAFPSGIIN